LTASGSGQELLERGRRDEVLNASAIDAVGVVPVLRSGSFVPFDAERPLSGA
jgi:2-phosphosulfolactate phosphatase